MTPLSALPSLRRPRERLRQFGADSLSLEELLAVILGSGSSGNSVLDVSSKLAVLLLSGRVSPPELADVPGVGPVKAGEIVAALHLSEALRRRSGDSRLDSPERILEACQDLVHEAREHLCVFYLTVRHQQIKRETVSIGTATASLVHPREVFRSAIVHGASHIVLVHNHPSGDPAPSQADLTVTARIAQAGESLGIELLDHVICARQGYYSLKERHPRLFRAFLQ